MKVLVVAPQPFFQERGTPMAVRLLVETLCDFGHSVDLLVYHEGADIKTPGLRLFRAPRPPGVESVPIGISWQKLLCDVGLVFTMGRLLLHNDYEIIHAVEEAVFPAALISLFSRHKLIYDMDSSLADQLADKWRMLRPLHGLFSLLEHGAVSRSAMVLAVCEDLAVKVRVWKDGRYVVVLPDVPMGDPIPAGVRETLRDVAGGDAVVGLYVGNLERYQGIDLLVEAVERISRDLNIQMLVIGGQRTHVEYYRDRARTRGVADRLHFLGPRPVARLNAYLQQADVLVSPRTLGQNTPMKVYSYMQSGKLAA